MNLLERILFPDWKPVKAKFEDCGGCRFTTVFGNHKVYRCVLVYAVKIRRGYYEVCCTPEQCVDDKLPKIALFFGFLDFVPKDGDRIDDWLRPESEDDIDAAQARAYRFLEDNGLDGQVLRTTYQNHWHVDGVRAMGVDPRYLQQLQEVSAEGANSADSGARATAGKPVDADREDAPEDATAGRRTWQGPSEYYRREPMKLWKRILAARGEPTSVRIEDCGGRRFTNTLKNGDTFQCALLYALERGDCRYEVCFVGARFIDEGDVFLNLCAGFLDFVPEDGCKVEYWLRPESMDETYAAMNTGYRFLRDNRLNGRVYTVREEAFSFK